MDVCKECVERVGVLEIDCSRPFPAWTVAAGTLATLAAATTGAILLVPVALVAGSLGDTRARHCEICGRRLGEQDEGYRLVQERQNERGDASYATVQRSDQAGQPDQDRHVPHSRHEHAGTQQSAEDSHPVSAGAFDEPEPAPSGAEYVFDEAEGMLVPVKDPPDAHSPLDGLSGWIEDNVGASDPELPLPAIGESATSGLTDLGKDVVEGIGDLFEGLIPKDAE